MSEVLAWLAAAVSALLGFSGEQQPARTFSVPKAKLEFRAETGLPLVNFHDASTPEVTSLRTKPFQTPRFGNFQLFVAHPQKIQRMRRVFTNGLAPDQRGIYWVSDRLGGWIAVTLYDRNLILAWFPPYRSREIDPSWLRLNRAVGQLAPPGKLKPEA